MDLAERLLGPQTVEEALEESTCWIACANRTALVEAVRELHRRLAAAKAEGAAEALRSLASGWHHHSGHETLPEAYLRQCQIGCTKCFILAEAKLHEDRAAAIRKGLEAKEGR